MREILEVLIKLQEEIIEEKRILKEIESTPQRVAELAEQLKIHENSLKDAEEKYKSTVTSRTGSELELKTLESKKKKLQDQLMTVKDNAQYKATLNEIEFFGKEIGSIEEKILTLMEDEDRFSTEKKRLQQTFVENQTRVGAEQEKINQRNEVLEADLAKLRSTQDEFRKQISPEILSQFNVVAGKKDGIGICGVADDGICRGCRYKIRPQVYSDLRSDIEIQHCDNCSRILYYIPPEIEEEKK